MYRQEIITLFIIVSMDFAGNWIIREYLSGLLYIRE